MVEMEVRNVSKGVEQNMVAFDFEHTPITQIADYIIITASNNGASDIHFDPHEDNMVVRLRIDGDLRDYTSIPKIYEKNLTTRLKLLANMNITETRLPQDGAIKGEFGGKYLDMRVSCLPLNTGEKIVIRILDYSRSLNGIEHLGFNQTNLKKLKRMIAVPNGIILITGATGSGKSTTVYSVLQALNRPETNIITVEDPIEMNIEGLNQVQVNAEIGMTFAAALRSILRQDPNVILIGEIRDSETAQIAVRASITGHLVLSTIHTNNSLSTIERLLDMDVERYLLSTALTGIISQRLAKKLCTHCRVERETTKYEKKVFKKFMNLNIDKIYDVNPKGCENCHKGYKGRIAIQEVLELDDEIRYALSNEKITKEELSEMVYNGKTITLLQDALGKAIAGITSFEEVYRVIELESDSSDDTSYLTKSLDDEDEEVKSEVQTDNLNSEISVVQNNNKDNNNVLVTPVTNEVAKNDNLVNDNVKQEVNKNAQLPNVNILTKEQALEQAKAAKEKFTEQKKADDERKIAQVLQVEQIKASNATKKVVVNAPNITPQPVTANKDGNNTLIKQAPTKAVTGERQLYQLPKSTTEQVKKPTIVPPKIEKKENPIPELNLKVKSTSGNIGVKNINNSPITEEENIFDDRQKVKAIDLNKISASKDLVKKDNQVINPLMPTIKQEENNSATLPIIIKSFAADEKDILPKIDGVKFDIIKRDVLTNLSSKTNAITLTKTPVSKLGQLKNNEIKKQTVVNAPPTTPNTNITSKNVPLSPIPVVKADEANKKVVIKTPTPVIPTIQGANNKAETPTNKVEVKNVIPSPIPVVKTDEASKKVVVKTLTPVIPAIQEANNKVETPTNKVEVKNVIPSPIPVVKIDEANKKVVVKTTPTTSATTPVIPTIQEANNKVETPTNKVEVKNVIPSPIPVVKTDGANKKVVVKTTPTTPVTTPTTTPVIPIINIDSKKEEKAETKNDSATNPTSIEKVVKKDNVEEINPVKDKKSNDNKINQDNNVTVNGIKNSPLNNFEQLYQPNNNIENKISDLTKNAMNNITNGKSFITEMKINTPKIVKEKRVPMNDNNSQQIAASEKENDKSNEKINSFITEVKKNKTASESHQETSTGNTKEKNNSLITEMKGVINNKDSKDTDNFNKEDNIKDKKGKLTINDNTPVKPKKINTFITENKRDIINNSKDDDVTAKKDKNPSREKGNNSFITEMKQVKNIDKDSKKKDEEKPFSDNTDNLKENAVSELKEIKLPKKNNIKVEKIELPIKNNDEYKTLTSNERKKDPEEKSNTGKISKENTIDTETSTGNDDELISLGED